MAWSDAARRAAALARKRKAGQRVNLDLYGNSASRSEFAKHLRAARKKVSLESVGGNPYARTDRAVAQALRSAGGSRPAAREMFFGNRPKPYTPRFRGG